jgi:hypothetical protein
MNEMTNEETSHVGYVQKIYMGLVKRNNTLVTKHKHDMGESPSPTMGKLVIGT